MRCLSGLICEWRNTYLSEYMMNAGILRNNRSAHTIWSTAPTQKRLEDEDNQWQKHKIGDFVEIPSLCGDDSSAAVRTALITDVPKSIDDCWGLSNKLPNGFYLEWIDDYYRYVDEPKYKMWSDEAHPIFVFKPRFHISDERKQELIVYSQDGSVLRSSYWRENGSEKRYDSL